MDKVKPIVSIQESAEGLFGAADLGGGVTIWCRRREVLERHADRAEGRWRAMEMADVRRLHAAGAIAADVLDRMEIRLLK